jgi:NTP pyrophosphatase (non-canonical NTP hydrolase)
MDEGVEDLDLDTSERNVDVGNLLTIGADLAAVLRIHGPQIPPELFRANQILALAEERGEAVKAYRRWAGLSRRTGTKQAFGEELADLIITAFITAAVFDEIDIVYTLKEKLDIIYTRGWREPR